MTSVMLLPLSFSPSFTGSKSTHPFIAHTGLSSFAAIFRSALESLERTGAAAPSCPTPQDVISTSRFCLHESTRNTSEGLWRNRNFHGPEKNHVTFLDVTTRHT